jgi:serine protease Do
VSTLLLWVLLGATPAKPVTSKIPWCTGAYADDAQGLSRAGRELNAKLESGFTSCVRTSAVYECLSYGSDGNVQRSRKEAVSHGTAFAYRRQNNETLLLTNTHVAEYPMVTDEEHPVAGIPAGCKRVADSLKIVDNEKDSFEGDDIPLTRVVSDPALDVAVVKTKTLLPVLPWRIGRSAQLKERNVVEVRGFPLGAFKATVEGRVTSVYDHDDFREWDHDDFVVDAQLSTGNSGSPVLAISCATGEYELVGIFHANYSRGSSLNVVVHIDQVRELMTTLKRSTAPRKEQLPLNVQTRRRLVEELHELGQLYLPLGPSTVQVRPREDGALIYFLYGHDFPNNAWPIAVMEDLERLGELDYGQLGRAWFGNAKGLKAAPPDALDAGDRLTLDRALEAIRRMALTVTWRRRAMLRAGTSREATEELARVEKELKRLTSMTNETAQALADLAEQQAPGATEPALPARTPLQAPEPPHE